MMFELPTSARMDSPKKLEDVLDAINSIRSKMTGKENAKTPDEIWFLIMFKCSHQDIVIAAKEMLVNQDVPILSWGGKIFFARTNEEKNEYLSTLDKRIRVLSQGITAVSRLRLPRATELEPDPSQPELEL